MKPDKYYTEWKKQFSIIKEINLDYITIGGFALILHGLPRATVDIDLAIPTTDEQILKVEKIAIKLNYNYDKDLTNVAIKTQHAVEQCLTLSDKSNIFHLDLFLIESVEFNKFKSNSQIMNYENIPITVAALQDIRELKTKANREIDKADIALIDKKIDQDK